MDGELVNFRRIPLVNTDGEIILHKRLSQYFGAEKLDNELFKIMNIPPASRAYLIYLVTGKYVMLILLQDGQSLLINHYHSRALDLPFVKMIYDIGSSHFAADHTDHGLYAIDYQDNFRTIKQDDNSLFLSEIKVEKVRSILASDRYIIFVVTYDDELVIYDVVESLIVQRTSLEFKVKSGSNKLLLSTDNKIFSINNSRNEYSVKLIHELDYGAKRILQLNYKIYIIGQDGLLRVHQDQRQKILGETKYKRFICYPQGPFIETVDDKIMTIPLLNQVEFPYKLLDPLEVIKAKRLKAAR